MSNYLRNRDYDGDWFDLFDDFFEDEFFPRHEFFSKKERNLMKTDIKETKDCYEFVVEVPGVKKDDLKMELHEGNLIVSYEIKNDDNEKKDNYIINERKVRSASRSYYLGRDYKEEDIKAKFDDGLLYITVPKEVKKAEKKYITIA